MTRLTTKTRNSAMVVRKYPILKVCANMSPAVSPRVVAAFFMIQNATVTSGSFFSTYRPAPAMSASEKTSGLVMLALHKGRWQHIPVGGGNRTTRGHVEWAHPVRFRETGA